jgi:hypothetical protein
MRLLAKWLLLWQSGVNRKLISRNEGDELCYYYYYYYCNLWWIDKNRSLITTTFCVSFIGNYTPCSGNKWHETKFRRLYVLTGIPCVRMIIEGTTETGRSRQDLEVFSAVQYSPLQHTFCEQFVTGKHNLECGNHSMWLIIH